MRKPGTPLERAKATIRRLRRELAESQQTLDAIRAGEVDALVVRGAAGNQIFTLNGAERPYRSFVEEMQQGALTLNQRGTVLYCNPRLAEILKEPAAKITGSAFENYLPAKARPYWQGLIKRAPKQRADAEGELIRADGSRVHTLISVNGYSFDKAAVCVVVAELARHRHTLDVSADEPQLPLLSESVPAVLGHEFRNTLAPIRNAAYVMKKTGADNPVLQKGGELIDRQVSQMANLLDDLMDISAISRGQLSLHKQELDLSKLLSGVIKRQRATLEPAGRILNLMLPRDPVCVYGDARRIEQLVLKLLQNAVKFTEREDRIAVELERSESNEAIIRVRDSGAGMSKATLSRIFKPFAQADQSLERSRGGIGLGLALVRGLAELHGGRVTARSAGLGYGSEFTVTLLSVARGK